MVRAEVHFDVARSLQDVLAAWRFLYDQYLRAGYIPSNPSGLYVCRQAIGPDTLVVLAPREGQVVGTISAIMDGPLGLPLDSVYPEELNALHTEDRRFFELGLLCQTSNSFRDLLELMRHAYYFAMYQGGTDCVCGIPPKWTRFYSRAVGFRPIGEVRHGVGNIDAPVQLIYISAEYAQRYFPRHRALNYIIQNPLPKAAFAGRFLFPPEALAGSPLAAFLEEA